ETIALMIRELGLARKPVSPKDKRTFPDLERPTQPGWLTIDLFGPWRLRATRAWLVTIQDRFTRAAAAVPAYSAMYATEKNFTVGVNASLWKQAILLGTTLCGRIERLYTDNGVGLAPTNRSLPSALQFALRYCDSVVFIPPGQPWRNGRLERFHRTLLTEWLLRSNPKRIEQFEQELCDYLNWYNLSRPHRALNFQSPSEFYGVNFPAIRLQLLEEIRGALPEPQTPFGKIECIRMVQNNGEVQLWQDSCFLPTVLAGQYVRFIFDLSNERGENYGRVVWQRRRGEDIVVAEFSHSFLMPNRKELPLIMGLVPHEFAHEEVPANQKLDEAEYAYQRAKRYKQPYKVSADAEGDAG
ncbi:MAG: integrase core domain-containing protein, partial [Fimbriimonadales bacterium]|nr:integrase core domain-containing protein [Fimbriimonadales bacterium]